MMGSMMGADVAPKLFTVIMSRQLKGGNGQCLPSGLYFKSTLPFLPVLTKIFAIIWISQTGVFIYIFC